MKRYLSVDVISRVVIDIVLINAAFLSGLLFRYFTLSLLKQEELSPQIVEQIWIDSIKLYAKWVVPLTLILLIVFVITGIYTRKRLYRGRYKLLAIFYAVTTAFLLFAVFLYISGYRNGFPRSLYILNWFFTLLYVGGARGASYILPKFGLVKPVPRNKIVKKKCENILVIGGAGYIGSLLSRKLLENGYNVRVLDALIYGREPLKELIGKDEFELIEGDFRNIDDVVKSMEGIDAVIHLGAIVGDPACSINDKITREINLASTRMIAEVAKGAGVRKFFFASTCSVYGASNDWLDERSSLNPLSLYAISKIESEKLLLSMQTNEFKPTIFRLATVHGFSYRPRFDLVVNLLSAMAIMDKKITIFGGNQWRPFVHVEDVARAFLLALDAPLELIGGKIYNLGDTNENYLISQIGEIISKIVTDAEVLYVEGKEDDRNYRVRFDKIKRQLGFTATRDISFTVKEIKEAIEKKIVTNYRDPKYSNYKYLSENDKIYEIDKETSIRYLSKSLQ